MERRWDRETNRARTAAVSALGRLFEELAGDVVLSDAPRVVARFTIPGKAKA